MTDALAPTEAPSAEVRIGDKIHKIKPFKGSKGVRAFAIISRVSRHIGAVMGAIEEFEREYRQRNDLTITRDLCRYRVATCQNRIASLERDLADLAPDKIDEKRESLTAQLAEAVAAEESKPEPTERRTTLERRLKDLDDAPRVREHVQVLIADEEASIQDWQRMLTGALADTDSITVPKSPSGQQKWMAGFPKVWELAEAEATMLLGLLLIEDDDLKAARDENRAEKAIMDMGEQALDELEVDEVGDLVVTAAEYALHRYRPRMARLGDRVEALQGTLTPSQDEPTERATQDPVLGPDRRQLEPSIGSVERTTSDSPSAESSTDSPPRTDGPPIESSTASPGPISSP